MKSTESSANSTVETLPFTVDRGALWRALMLIPSVAWPVWTIAAAAVALIIAGIISSLPLLIVGLLMLFAIFPASASFILLHKVTSKEMISNIIPHTLHRLPDGWQVNLFRKSVDTDADGIETVGWHQYGSVTVPDNTVTKIRHSIDHDILFIKAPSLSLLFIPR